MNFGSDTVLSKSPDFMNFGILSVNITYELESIFVTTYRVGRPKNGSNWLLPGHDISDNTSDGVRETKAKNHYSLKSDFERRRKIQDFGRQNNPMSRPTLDLTPIGKNTTNGTTSPIDSIPVGTKCQILRQILRHWHDQRSWQNKIENRTYQGTRTQIHHRQNYHQRNIITWMIVVLVNQGKRNEIRRKRQKDKRDDLSEPSSSDDSDLSYNIYYRCKRRKRKIEWKQNPIKLCARLTEKLLTTSNKSKIIRFKMDKDPLHRRIYFLTCVESPEMIFSQYTETVKYF